MIHTKFLNFVFKSLKNRTWSVNRSQELPTKLNFDKIGGAVSDQTKAWVYFLFYQVCVQDGILRDEEVKECNRLYRECFGEDVTNIKSDRFITGNPIITDTSKITGNAAGLPSPSDIINDLIIPKVGQFRIEVMAKAFNEVYSSYQRKALIGLCFRLVMVDGQGDKQEYRFIKQVGYRFLLTPEEFSYAFDSALRTR